MGRSCVCGNQIDLVFEQCRKDDENIAKYKEECRARLIGGSGVLGGGAVLSPTEAK